MLKNKISLAWLAACLFVMFAQTTIVFAAEEKNPITEIKKEMTFNWGVLENLGFLFYLIMIPLSLIIIGIIVLVIWRIVRRVLKASTGKEVLSDKKFWIEIGCIILIVFIFMSGMFWDFLEAVYTWTANQDITKEATKSGG